MKDFEEIIRYFPNYISNLIEEELKNEEIKKSYKKLELDVIDR